MKEIIKAVEEAIIRKVSIQENDMKGLADLVNSYTNLVKAAAGTATFDKHHIADVLMKKAGWTVEETYNFLKHASSNDVIFVLACEELAQEMDEEQRVTELEKKVAAGTTTEKEIAERFQASRKSEKEFHFVRI